MKSLLLVLIFFFVFVYSSENLRGVNPNVLENYKNEQFTCDKTKKIALNRVNDDYCDCQDGSDEPGTNACNNGQFWCRNAEWIGNSIQSSKVNDGICDCCDGSDEWQGKVNCKNTCVEKREVELKSKKEKLEKGKRGLLLRDAYIESAKGLADGKRRDLDQALEKITEIADKVNSLEADKIKLEEKEKIAIEIRDLLNKDLSKPDEPKPDEAKKEDDGGPDDVEAPPQMTEEERQEKVNALRKKLGEDDHERVIQEINELRSRLSELKIEENRLKTQEREINEYFNLDFGPSNVYAELYDRCFEHQTKEYTYKLCFFKKCDQGHTTIGNWKEWKKKYDVMVYEGGASCWNGPTRQTTVYLTCGEKDSLTHINEPSKCIYEYTFETPAACSPEDLQSLEVDFGTDIQY